MNMGQAMSEMAEKYERMDRQAASECRDFNGKANEHCTLQKGHKGQHYGWMFRWEQIEP